MRYLDISTRGAGAGPPKRISKIGLGTWQFGAAEWGYGEPYARRTAQAIVRRALDLGITLFDTAEIYAAGASERILGQALNGSGASVVLATKLFPVLPSAALVRQRAAASASRLGVPFLDLYQVHFPSPLVSDGVIMRGMRSLQRSGLVGDAGVSNYSLARWRAAEAALGGRVLSNQVQYNLLDRAPERELLPWAQAHGRVIVAFSPLAQGLLSGRYHRAARPADGVRGASPRFAPDGLERTRGLVDVLRELAAAHRASPAQIALAWTIHRPGVAAIPGASSVGQVERNAEAAEITLAADEYEALCRASVRAGADGTGDHPGSGHSLRFALRHTARGGWHVARTAWRDRRGTR